MEISAVFQRVSLFAGKRKRLISSPTQLNHSSLTIGKLPVKKMNLCAE
jgi:hypothetical protein